MRESARIITLSQVVLELFPFDSFLMLLLVKSIYLNVLKTTKINCIVRTIRGNAECKNHASSSLDFSFLLILNSCLKTVHATQIQYGIAANDKNAECKNHTPRQAVFASIIFSRYVDCMVYHYMAYHFYAR